MSGILLTWDTAHADAHDNATRNMRAALRTAWNEEDAAVYVDRLEHLALVFYRENCAQPYGPLDLRLACMALSETKGTPFVFVGAKPPRRVLELAELLRWYAA